MKPHAPTGWNTWDYRGFNRLLYLRKGRVELAIQYALWDEYAKAPADDPKRIGRLHDQFRWSDVRTLGPHGPLGLPAILTFTVGDTPIEAEAREEKGGLLLTVRPQHQSRFRVVFLLIAPEGRTPRPESPTEGQFAGWTLELDGATWPTDYFLNMAYPYAVGAEGQPATLRARPRSKSPPPSATAPLPSLEGGGATAEAPEAMMRAVAWNTLYDTRRQLVSSPVSRDWCYDWRGVLVFCWDTFLVGAMSACESPELARLNFETVCAAIDRLGFVPNYDMSHGAASLDRSMPPLGSYMIWKTQMPAPDHDWLAKWYPKLRRWHGYWMRHRDGNGDGLLEWGSNSQPPYEFPQLRPYNPHLQHEGLCAMYEAGLDNSPMYDDAVFNKDTSTFELTDVALNSYYAMDCEALAAIARCLSRERDALRYEKEYALLKKRINAHLWDDDHGIYANRHWDGRFSTRWSPTSFFPLIAGVAERWQVEHLVAEHLMNEEEFWGSYVLPSIARNDPAYPDNDYWRGRIWGPFNFLVAEGLRRYRRDVEAAELARRGLEMFMANWKRDGGVYENYNAQTGEGGDVWNAARLYHWGGLMVFVAIGELIDLEPAGWLRFGSVSFPEASIRNVHVGGRRYEVSLGDGIEVRRDGALYLQSTTRAIVRLPIPLSPDRPIMLSATNGGRLVLHESFPEDARVVLNDHRELRPRQDNATWVVEWDNPG